MEVHHIPNVEFAAVASPANKIRLFLPEILIMLDRLEKVTCDGNGNGLAEDYDEHEDAATLDFFADQPEHARSAVESVDSEEEEVNNLLMDLEGLLVEGKNKIDFQRIAARIYNEAVRPALQRLMPDWMGHFPSSYETEVDRVRAGNGRFGQSRHGIRPEILDDFSRLVIENLNDITWGKGAFFGHESRGIKDKNSTTVMEWDLGGGLHTQKNQVERACPFLDVDKVFAACRNETATWYVDKGVEVTVPEMVALIRKTSHTDLVAFFLGVDIQEARRLISSKTRYQSDEICHLSQAAGLRLKGEDMGPMRAVYLQVYCSEKIPTYHVEDHKQAKTLTLKEALTDLVKGGGRKIQSRMMANRDIFLDQTNVTEGFSVRAEVRAPIIYAHHTEQFLPREIFAGKFYLLNLVDYWYDFSTASTVRGH